VNDGRQALRGAPDILGIGRGERAGHAGGSIASPRVDPGGATG
jgi:hypothetical protein